MASRVVRTLLIVVAACSLPTTAASQGGSATGTTGTGRIAGVVHDSLLARGPLAGAEVLLDGLGRVATTDAEGRFAFDSVPAGTWRLAFFHPQLEPFGITPPPASVTVAAGATARARLVTPSPAVLQRALCGVSPSPEIGVLLVASAGASAVRAEWQETTLGADLRVSRATRRQDGRALGDGHWLVCPLPAGAEVVLVRDGGGVRQVAGVQTAEFALVRVPAPVAEGDMPAERVRVVVRDSGGRALPRAAVRLTDRSFEGPAGDDGGATLPRHAERAQGVEARAIGYVPVSTTLAAGEDVRLMELLLPPAYGVVDMVRVTATSGYLDRVGFEDRRKQKLGHYITQAEIERRKPQATGDLFIGIPGLKVTNRGGQTLVTTHRSEGQAGKYGGGGACQPVYFIDGVRLTPLGETPVAGPNSGARLGNGGGGGGPMTFDSGPGGLVSPYDIAGIEVYLSLANAPPQYRVMDSGCGVILFWTRRGAAAR